MISLPPELTPMLVDNATRFRAAGVDAWSRIPEPDIIEWIEANLRFGPGDGDVQLESRKGPMTYADSPWWKFVLRCAVDPRVTSIAIPAATQTHKTASLIIALSLFLAEFRPGPGMIVFPDENEARTIRDRIYRLVQESKKFTEFYRLRIPPQHKWNLQQLDLGSMVIHLAWAGSKQRTRGKPCYYVFFNEVDVYPPPDNKAGDPVEAGKQRTKDVFRYKHLFESSPSEEPSTICDEESLSDVRWRWYFSCPYCGRKQESRFFQHKGGEYAGRGGIETTVRAMGSEGDALLTPQQARKHSHYVCEAGCKIENDRKTEVIEDGEWYPLGWEDGEPEPDRTPTKTVGFHLWAIHSPAETFGSIAEDYLRHRAKGLLADFFGNRLALPYRPATRVPKWSVLGKRNAWTNARRTVPDRAWFLTCGVDKQGENNGTRYVVRGWAPGRTSWLVDWGWLERDENLDDGAILSDLIALESRVLAEEFQVVDRDNRPSSNPLGRDRLAVRLTNIDTNHLPLQIHRWQKERLPERWLDRMAEDGETFYPGRVRNIRGDHKVSRDLRYRRTLVESNTRTGEKYEDGLHLWGVNVYPFYSDLIDQIGGKPGGLGAWYVTADALANGRPYLEQVTNFGYAVKIHPKKGKVGEWGPISTRIPVDFWDCEIYATVAAEMVVGANGWTVEAFEEMRQASRKADKKSKRKRSARGSSGADSIGAR